jgi:hypothetical protein
VQSGGQHVAHLDSGRQAGVVGPVEGCGDLAEHPVGQPAAGALLGLQALGDFDTKGVARQIGTRRAQSGVRRIDDSEVRTHPGVHRRRGERFADVVTHETRVSNICSNARVRYRWLWMNAGLWTT